MLRARIPHPHRIELLEQECPQPGAGEVLLRVQAVGICGSDLHTFEGLHPFVSYPVWPGHEVCADVIACGAGTDAAWIGQTVVIEPSLPGSGRPRFEPGRYNIATELAVMGFQAPGAMAEFFAVPTDRLHRVPLSFTPAQGASVEPAAVAVHGVRRSGDVAGRDVAILGGGTIGLLTAMTSRAYGAATVRLVDPDPARRALVTSLGLDAVERAGDGAFDRVFECVGNESALRAGIRACRKGATLVVLGVFGREASVPFGLVQDWELDIRGSLMYTGDDFREAIRLLDLGLLEIDGIVTHRFPLVEVERAFETALRRGGVVKVLLEP
jgi:L-iditol 2-dehydrogenase